MFSMTDRETPETVADFFDDYFDPNEFYTDVLPSWETLWNDELTHYQNLKSITKRIVVLPNQRLHLPIAVTYLMQPTRPAKCLPILASIGEAGSGKSTFTFLATQIRGLNNCFSPKDTSSSVRNAVDAMRYPYEHARQYEKEGAIVCWDNLSIKKIESDENIYGLFLAGYNVRTAIMQIANSGKSNYVFNTFCPKVISTIDPLHAHPEFKELHRRLWVIPHKKIAHFTEEEIASLGEDYKYFLEYKVEFQSISWENFHNVFFSFWNRENCKLYAKHRSFLVSQNAKRVLHIPELLQGELWEVCPDPIATGLCIGTWKDYQEAINHVVAFIEDSKRHAQSEAGATIDYLKKLIQEESERCISLGQAIVVDATRLKMYLDSLSKSGAINELVNPRKVSEWMDFLGYKLTTKGWIQK